MSHVRSLVRVASLLAVSLGLFAVRMLLVPVSVVAAGAEQRSGGWLFKVWGHACLRILGIRTQRDGTLPATSAGPYVIVSNHLGYLDIPLFAAHTGGIFVSNARIRRWPLIGFLAARIGTIFMRRSRKRAIMPAIEHIAAALNAGRPVIFFPEGTSSPGLTVMPFRSNLFEAVVHANVPVFCAAVRYSSPDPSIDPTTDIAWSDTPLGPARRQAPQDQRHERRDARRRHSARPWQPQGACFPGARPRQRPAQPARPAERAALDGRRHSCCSAASGSMRVA